MCSRICFHIVQHTLSRPFSANALLIVAEARSPSAHGASTALSEYIPLGDLRRGVDGLNLPRRG